MGVSCRLWMSWMRKLRSVFPHTLSASPHSAGEVCHFTWPKETAISVTLGIGVLHVGIFMPTTHISSGLHLTLIYSLKLWLPPHRFPTSILYLYEFHTPSWAYWITSTVSASVCPVLATFIPVTLGITNSHTGEWTACPFFSFMTPVHKRTR